jgi:lactate dehydrogenase-like 2-hydroxyacid dehydrogenase
VSGKKLGILGLGTIGQKIAKRAAAFDMEVGYHNRKPREGSTHRYFDDLKSLAAWADFLVLAAPGGPATRHLVNAEVLDALGPQGYLVSIGRGSVVDTEALGAALREHRIAGAGVDVYESEPKRPEPLVGLDNVLLTPHMAGWSPEATQRRWTISWRMPKGTSQGAASSRRSDVFAPSPSGGRRGWGLAAFDEALR